MPAEGPFAGTEPPLQGKALSYNNVLDASAAAALARLLDGPAVVIVKHTNPCGAAERATLVDAWDAALAGDPVSAFGGVVAVTGTVDRALAERLTSLFLEVVVAPAYDAGAREVLAGKPNLRLVVDPSVDAVGGPRRAHRPRPARGRLPRLGADGRRRGPRHGAGHACPTTRPRGPSSRPDRPTDAERRDLDLAWRLVRGVVSNAIVLVRDGMLVGLGSGQVSRVDACRQAVDKAAQFQGEAGARGAVAASDAFFPFPDGPRLLLGAGVTAIVQPGGSVRDAEILVAVEEAGAAMLVTGTRHFRH